MVVIPQNFERDVVRGLNPEILIAADASDPSAAGGAVGALSGHRQCGVCARRSTGPLAACGRTPPPFSVVVHRDYNPEGRTSTNIVPGLLAIILSMTMVMITAVAIVKESERGTMEMLIATPVRPLEVMLGKILPYVFVGYVQTGVFLAAASALLFAVPFDGSWVAFFIGFNLFIVVNLALGFLISTAAQQPDAGDAAELLHRSCRRSCCPASCFRSRACRAGRRPSAAPCPPRISSASSAR